MKMSSNKWPTKSQIKSELHKNLKAMKMSSDRLLAKSQLTIIRGIFKFSNQVPNKKRYINHDSLNIRLFTKHIT